MVNSVQEFEMRRYLKEALKSGVYFITITYMEGEELKHFYICNEFPHDDLFATLGHMADELEKQHSAENNS